MSNFNDITLLELVECYAVEENICSVRRKFIESEEDLSKMFDEQTLPQIIEQYSEDDQPAINEGFNNWSDSLCKDGMLHSEQYNNYCYVGVKSNG